MRPTQRNLLRTIGIAAILMLGVYFSYHAMYGEEGVRKQRLLEAEVADDEAKLEKLQADRAVLEKRTKGLRPDSLDADMLEEQARKQLGYTKEGEKVILTP